MKNNYFTILGIVLCLFMGCNSDDEDVKAVENMPDWFKIEDKPGEINHLIYGIYKDYGYVEWTPYSRYNVALLK